MKNKKVVDQIWSTIKLREFSYFLSGWIANLGVVPLFLLAAFLLLPIFFALFALLVLVMRVLETIFQPLAIVIQHKRIEYLSLKMLIVKALIVTSAYATEQNTTLTIGEHYELSISNLKEYSVGNKEILATRYNSKSKKLLIKAQKLGHTELLVWRSTGPKERHSFYVIDKRIQLKLQQKMEILKKNELDYELQGTRLVIKGAIDGMEKYKIIHELAKDSSATIQAKLSALIRNQIILEAYQAFYNEHILDVKCDYSEFNINCYYFKEMSPSEETLSFLKKKFYINFIKRKLTYPNDNFQLKMKIIGLEREDGSEVNFGLDQLESNISTLFNSGLISFIESNQVFFKSNHLEASTLAEPELVMKNNEPSLIQVGSEVPYQHDTKEGMSTSWKFAGLKVNLKLTNKGRSFFLKYKTEFTSHGEGPVQGNKESAILRVDLNKPIKLFEVGLTSQGKKKTGIPLLKDIPFLGNLFSNTYNTENYKRIIAYVTIDRIQ